MPADRSNLFRHPTGALNIAAAAHTQRSQAEQSDWMLCWLYDLDRELSAEEPREYCSPF